MAKKSSKKKKISFNELTDEELVKQYKELKGEIQQVRFDLVTSSVSNVRRIRQAKRDVARVLTAQNQRKRAAKQAESVS